MSDAPMQILWAAALALVGALAVWRLRAPLQTYRAGPWPGLTTRGAGLLVGHALLLAAELVLAGNPPRTWTDLAWLSLASLAPLVLATCLVRMPGVASAVCGAYLLPRSMISLVEPSIPLPPPLIVPALVFDLVVWLRADDLRAVVQAWPRGRVTWRTPDRGPRRLSAWRVGLASLAFVAVLVVLAPAFAAFSGTGTGS
jgi:hypothetical protein